MSVQLRYREDRRPLIAHILFRLDYGGLENGVVNIVNGLPEHEFRHAIIALTEASDFRLRIRRSDVSVYEMKKPPGNSPTVLKRLFRLMRELRPAIVHTRNLGTLEAAAIARVAGVRARIHGEHGWDVYDPTGASWRYRTLRRIVSPCIDRFVVVSREIEQWLTGTVGIAASKVTRICNGVDTERFRPPGDRIRDRLPQDRFPVGSLCVGSVTRFSAIKDPLNLVSAFIAARRDPSGSALRLAMVGDGPLRVDAERMLANANLSADAWLPGSRDDIPELLREFDLFALGSTREGISNTVLEAMAAGLPVVASATGGNLELVDSGVTGQLVQPQDAGALSTALLAYARDSRLRIEHGIAARRRVEQHYSLQRMVADYGSLYRGAAPSIGEAA